MNPDETLYLIMNEYFDSETLKLEETRYKGPYKMFTEYDLENLNYMQEQIRMYCNPVVDFDSLLANYCGQNVFSIFYEDEKLLEYLRDKITNQDDDPAF